MSKFTNKQRVYIIWLGLIDQRQQLDKHDGDQAWLTDRKSRLLARTQKNGRRFDKNMNVDSMARDILSAVMEEARDLIKSSYRKAS